LFYFDFVSYSAGNSIFKSLRATINMSGPKQTPGQEPVLSFEEFAKRAPFPRYDNLHMYFVMGIGENYRENPHYQTFANEHRVLNQMLLNRVPKRDMHISTTESLRPFDPFFYEFYLAMRGYGATDKDVFD
jgi:hypothetical protein